MTMRRTHFVVLILCIFFCGGAAVSAQNSEDAKNKDTKNPADTVVLHGRIYTLDSKQPWAQGLAIRTDKIVAVGDDATIAQAVEGYTLGATFAGRREKSEGSLEKGKLADLIIVSQNIF